MTTNKKDGEIQMPEVTIYSVGVVSASVCSRLTIEETTKELNRQYPTGISSQWVLSDEKTFKNGQENGCQCPDDSRNKHYLFNC